MSEPLGDLKMFSGGVLTDVDGYLRENAELDSLEELAFAIEVNRDRQPVDIISSYVRNLYDYMRDDQNEFHQKLLTLIAIISAKEEGSLNEPSEFTNALLQLIEMLAGIETDDQAVRIMLFYLSTAYQTRLSRAYASDEAWSSCMSDIRKGAMIAMKNQLALLDDEQTIVILKHLYSSNQGAPMTLDICIAWMELVGSAMSKHDKAVDLLMKAGFSGPKDQVDKLEGKRYEIIQQLRANIASSL